MGYQEGGEIPKISGAGGKNFKNKIFPRSGPVRYAWTRELGLVHIFEVLVFSPPQAPLRFGFLARRRRRFRSVKHGKILGNLHLTPPLVFSKFRLKGGVKCSDTP